MAAIKPFKSYDPPGKIPKPDEPVQPNIDAFVKTQNRSKKRPWR